MRVDIWSAPAGEDAMSVSLTRRSEGLAAQDFNGQSDYADLSSGDGVYIVFSTDAANSFLGDSNGVSDIWRQNGQSGALERVSSSATGGATDGASFSPVISADGRYVAFASLATNLTLNDGNGFADVFCKDMITGAVLIVSAAPDRLSANSVSLAPAISADGRYIAFLSAANNLVADDTNYSMDVFRTDMLTLKTLRVNLAAGGTEASAGALNAPSISADDDVLDGGLGSNFLTGGAGKDTFFIDGRGAHYGGSGTWSTIADLSAGEAVTIWGYRPGESRFIWLASDGAAGFKGATMHCDLNGNGLIDTSITWAGLAQAQLPKPIFGPDYIFFG